MMINSIIAEFRRYKQLGEKTIDQVADKDLTAIVGADNNSISILVGHLSGNLKSRFTDFLTTDGEKEWRNRDGEFEEPQLSRTELLELWEAGWTVLFNTLDSLHDNDLAKVVKIRGIELTVIEALHRSLAHVSYHVGQIVLIGRSCVGDKWQSLSIPKKGSAEYNANPTKEKIK
ncbi:MAG: DUF1572 domain-containing protein [Calditrichaeota bacterium]|nr:MAG: DUF1572 domain-containing protein [Calditrichota bacterium]